MSLVYTIGFVLDVELACFAVVLGIMAWQDPDNRALRWLALGYFAGLMGAVLDYSSGRLPLWAGVGLAMEAAPIGYACFHASIVELIGRWRASRWVSVAMAALSLPVFFRLSYPGVSDRLSRAATLQDAILTVQTALSAWLLLIAVDPETHWPRRTMAAFLAAYSAIECARVAVYLATGRMPADIAPVIEIASGMAYVVSCAALPLAFIWMMNARLHASLRRQALTDPLTGLANRRHLELDVNRALAQPAGLALAIMDIDHFKQLNDNCGHPAGDEALRRVAEFLQACVPPETTVGRLGGEEFLLLLPGRDDRAAFAELETLRRGFETLPLRLADHEPRLTASFGLTCVCGRPGMNWATLLHEADQALYAAKRAGRNRVEMARAAVR